MNVPEVRLPVMVSVAECTPVDWNPNEESEPMFGQLVEKIRQEGFKHPIDVVKNGEGYRIVAGEHRWKAAQVVGLLEIPAYVEELSNEDEAQIRNIRDNVVRGKVDPARFTRIYGRLANKYGPDALRRMMGLTEETAFRALYRDAQRHLPPEIRKRLAQSDREVATIDDMGRVLQAIFAKYGSTVDLSFVVFSFGGREHVLVRCEKRAWDNLQRIEAECIEAGVDLNVRLNQLLEQYVPLPE